MNPCHLYIEDYERSSDCRHYIITNRAFLYGESASTCSLLRRGKILFLSDHLDRLERSWCSFYPRCPRALLRAKLLKNIAQIPRQEQDYYVRISLFANDSKRSFERCRDDRLPNLIIHGEEYLANSSKVVSLKTMIKTAPLAKDVHKPSYYIDELHDRAAQKDGSDILYLNSAGYVLESTTSNIFFIYQNGHANDGTLITTPQLTPFILPGITRKHLIRVLNKVGIPLRETPVHRSELLKITGALLSNSLHQIIPVNKLDGQQLDCPFILELQQLYQRACEEELHHQ